MTPKVEQHKVEQRKLSEDDSVGGWEIWKLRAEQTGIVNVLSDTALMLLWISLGTNVWRKP